MNLRARTRGSTRPEERSPTPRFEPPPPGTVAWRRSPADDALSRDSCDDCRSSGPSGALLAVLCCGLLPVLLLILVGVAASGLAGAIVAAALVLLAVGIGALRLRARGRSRASGG
jgi:hypothetical protein